MRSALFLGSCRALNPTIGQPTPTRTFSVHAMASTNWYPYGLQSLSAETTMENTLKRLGSRFDVIPLPADSPFVKPASVLYELDGKQRRWDIIQAHSSVACVLYQKDMDCFLVVRQFRPAVYAHKCREAEAAGLPRPNITQGFTIELCAGLVDKAKSLPQIVAEEIHEEVGYDVPLQAIQKVSTAVAASGNNGADSHQFYAEIDNSMRANAGGGLQHTGEAIEVLALPFNNVPAFVTDDTIAKSTGLMFGLFWAYSGLLDGQLEGRQGSSSLQTGDIHLKSVLPS